MKRPSLFWSKCFAYATVVMVGYSLAFQIRAVGAWPCVEERVGDLGAGMSLFYLSFGTALVASALRGIARGRKEVAPPKGWRRIVFWIAFWTMPVCGVALAASRMPIIGINVVDLWFAWAALVAVAKFAEVVTVNTNR